MVVGTVFREQEDAAGYLQLLQELTEAYGIPGAIYRDGHSAFEPTHPRRTDPDDPGSADDRGVERFALGVDGDQTVNRDARPSVATDTGAMSASWREARDDMAEGGAPVGRVLLSPGRVRVLDLVGGRRLGQDANGRTQQDPLETLRANVDTGPFSGPP